MPRKLRILSGNEVIKILERNGFVQTRITGSHVRLTLQTKNGEDFHVTIPLHKELKRGTLKGIISELEKLTVSDEINSNFYTK
ncbi:MAG: hypothetical protein A3C70_02255 [Candidatus Zambryskibacteria bacterium RIFCSPHIGHO2_02_FULL_43_14]|uniref:Addiction module toxin, HicA family n=1 Tax=Candidatus Zambryskibacteria bacterium RIFCSPHIGHO2_02_FULL_43_14 TaxID=1802748 RepID=A0A1G2TEG2_9BACT|nr:MAG: hypothetical protein A2829_02290 [Candidatus Zambryskibacteria bacterium RIFCSPHIGHO2_01_FULL_43_60]OHA95633.1 MAG: hypothetical protein A3C70_02255 [Candidatus Zambryskibacteria bacterium RIFCSPHIGHO2_02_FULL_43_14]OHB03325.1 MAG: hypothetical protein A3B03_03090 [Candidatus Zambryskibacteria bacterium RIFCSPLOWO2_01_FULL_42_41]